jgi:hypothetical protein
MSVIELKTEFHKLIDSVENEARLYFLGRHRATASELTDFSP